MTSVDPTRQPAAAARRLAGAPARSLWCIALTLAILSLLAACGGRASAPSADAPTVSAADVTTPTSPAPDGSTTAVSSSNTATPAAPPEEGAARTGTAAPSIPPSPPGASPLRVPVYGFELVATFPHDPAAYTQGLQFVDGELYEGTGQRGASQLRRVDLETGAVLQQHQLADEFFGEGIAVVDDRIYQLTWQEGVAFLYDRASFKEMKRFDVPTEGYGLTWDGTQLIMSDGTKDLYFRDPESFEESGRVGVSYLGRPINEVIGRDTYGLNELEFIDGEVWANVYGYDFILRIDPATGVTQGLVDLAGLRALLPAGSAAEVLNGIAYDAEGDRLFVTGKLWPALYQIQLVHTGWAEPAP